MSTNENKGQRPLVGLGIYICYKGKVLFLKRIAKHGAESWTVPGGHVEFGESWEETARREALEEVGVVIQNPKLFAVTNDVFDELNKHYVTLHIEAQANDATFTNNEPDKQQQLGWYEWDKIPQPHALWFANLLKQNLKPEYLN